MTPVDSVDLNNSGTHTLPGKDLSLASAHEALEIEQGLWQEPQATKADHRSVNTIRGLVLDCCQQWKVCHGGSCCSLCLH